MVSLCCTVNAVNDYFSKLDRLYTEHNLHNRPEAIFNMDESYFGRKQEGFNRRTIGRRGGYVPKQQQVFTADHTTIVSCISAGGIFLPNMLVYTKSLPTERYKDQIPDDWVVAWTDTGYINTSLFERWFFRLFVPNCGVAVDKPVLLIMDNCSTHYSYKVIKYAKENNIHIICEPPHTSHILQPLDKIFLNLKDDFSRRCYAQKVVDCHATVNKANMAIKIKEAQESSWRPSVVKGAFKRVGIFPLDISQIDERDLVGKGSQQSASSSDSSSQESISPYPSSSSVNTSYSTSPSTTTIPYSRADTQCPSCSKQKETTWILCPYCGYGGTNPLCRIGGVIDRLQHCLPTPNFRASNEEKVPNRRSKIPSATELTGKEFWELYEKRKL